MQSNIKYFRFTGSSVWNGTVVLSIAGFRIDDTPLDLYPGQH